MKTSHVVSMLAVLVVIAGGSFYAGTAYGKNQAAVAQQAARANRGGGGPGGFGGGGGANGGFVNGQILSKDDKSITIKDRAGGSKIVFLSASTQVMKAASGSVSDLTVGANVTTIGTPNADGSITAQTVQIRPQMPQDAGSTKTSN